MEQVLTLGMTPKQWIDLLKGDEQRKVRKSLNYLDGKHEEEVIAVLNDPHAGRTNWRQKGFIPRYRNVTKMIVEKSAQLYIDSMPTFELWMGTDLNEVETQKLKTELDKIPFMEIMNNVDQTLRLLKTVFLLFQYDAINSELVIDILHRGNCEVIVDGSKKITGMIYVTGDKTFRIITETEIIDLMNNEHDQISIVGQVPNPYGIVPVSVFYDTRIPRNGTWMSMDYDLINFNESYNLHLTDADYSMKWAKLPTLFMIDCGVEGDGTDRIQEILEPGSKLPTQRPMGPDVNGGPGSIVNVNTNGMGGGSVEYKGPNADIRGMDEVYYGWCKGIAADWSVRIDTEGGGSVSSGFQLVVEEMPNLELRKQRQRMYESGFKRAWNTIRTVLNVSSTQSFNDSTELFVDFMDPVLPVDAGQQEEVWTKRIDSGRATVIDYFMKELGLSKEEAMDKYKEIVEFQLMNKELLTIINKDTVGETVDNPPEEDAEDTTM